MDYMVDEFARQYDPALIPLLQLIMALMALFKYKHIYQHSFTIHYLLLRNICENPAAWLASNTWDLINSPVFHNTDLVRDRWSLEDANEGTAFWNPSARAVSASVTADSPSCRQAVTGSTPAAQMPEPEPCWSAGRLSHWHLLSPFAEQMTGSGCAPLLTATQRDGVWAARTLWAGSSDSSPFEDSGKSGIFAP